MLDDEPAAAAEAATRLLKLAPALESVQRDGTGRLEKKPTPAVARYVRARNGLALLCAFLEAGGEATAKCEATAAQLLRTLYVWLRGEPGAGVGPDFFHERARLCRE